MGLTNQEDQISETTSVPDGLQDLAMRVPLDIRTALPDWELLTRCIYSASLYAEAAVQEAEAAESTRIKASRVLASLPVDQYLARVAYYDSCLQTAARAENADECARAYAALCQLQWTNIYPSEDALSVIAPGIAAEMAFGNTAASRAAGFKAAR